MGVVAGLVAVPAFLYGFGWYMCIKFNSLERDFARMWVWALLFSLPASFLALVMLIAGELSTSICAGVFCIVATTVQILIFNRTHVPYSADE